MGTRTWSRKGVLTLAGMRRYGLVGQITARFDAPSQYAPRPLAADTFAKGGEFETTLRQRVIDGVRSGTVIIPRTDLTADDYIAQLQNADFADLIDNRDGAIIAQQMLYNMLGYNAPPTIESWDDIEAGKGLETYNGYPLMGYRGLYGNRSNKVPFEDWDSVAYANDLRTGDTHWVGRGLQGNGTYVASIPTGDTLAADYLTKQPVQQTMENRRTQAKNVADDFATDDGNRQVIATAIGLKRGARTNVAEAFAVDNATDATAQLAKEFTRRYGITLKNPAFGIIGSALGYDALYVLGSSRDVGHLAIFNRGKMVVSSTDRTRDDAGLGKRPTFVE